MKTEVMMTTGPVYFDSSLFLAIFNGEKTGPEILELLKELKKRRIRAITSIVTIQEVSVVSYRLGTVAADHYARVHKLARIEGITKDVALTAAKLEAQLLDRVKDKDASLKQHDNRRRKWDCFHIATAMCLHCRVLYSCDADMRGRKQHLSIRDLEFCEPNPKTYNPPLFNYETQNVPPVAQITVPGPAVIRGSGDGHTQDQARTEAAEATKEKDEADPE